jgi:two-component system, chemotaxis family, chemotaxis protein CheY
MSDTQEIQGQTTATPAAPVASAAPTAIVVDDSPIMRGLLRRALVGSGFKVVAEVASADNLVELYETHRPDLVTLDIVMPGRDGATAAAELLERHREAIVVMCTSVTTRDKILACQRAGVTHYLLKPFDQARAEAIFKYALAVAQGRK